MMLVLLMSISRVVKSRSNVRLMRLISVTMLACAVATLPELKVVYSPVAATARRYVRRLVPEETGVKMNCDVFVEFVEVAGPALMMSSSKFDDGEEDEAFPVGVADT